MLKKRYNGKIVLIVSFAAFIIAMAILWLFQNKYHFAAKEITCFVIGMAIIIAILAIRVTYWRKAEVIVQPSDYPPNDINPIQAGCIIDDIINPRDVSAAFYYMAQKGYFDINEYEFKKFEFTKGEYPVHEEKAIQYIYNAIFKNGDRVKLVDAAPALIKALPGIQKLTYTGIANRRNKEIADLTGKVHGFKESLVNNRDDKVRSLVDADNQYFFKVLPYAYAFSITAKLSSNFGDISVDMPGWYHPYGVADDCVFDVIIYNSMLRNLPEELRDLVFSKTVDTYPSKQTNGV